MTHEDLLRALRGEPEGRPERQLASVWPLYWPVSELAEAWRHEQAQAKLAYDAWRRSAGTGTYAVYRAAQDRADAAQDALRRASVREGALAAARAAA